MILEKDKCDVTKIKKILNRVKQKWVKEYNIIISDCNKNKKHFQTNAIVAQK